MTFILKKDIRLRPRKLEVYGRRLSTFPLSGRYPGWHSANRTMRYRCGGSTP